MGGGQGTGAARPGLCELRPPGFATADLREAKALLESLR